MRMRRTCRSCFSAKVKCSSSSSTTRTRTSNGDGDGNGAADDGGAPCDRCVERGEACVFDAERKRGRPRGVAGAAAAAAARAGSAHAQGLDVLSTAAGSTAASWWVRDCWAGVSAAPRLPAATMPAAAAASLSEVERRVIRVFFALYVHHRSSHSHCCRRWFELQMGKLLRLWRMRGVESDATRARFLEWAEEHDLHLVAASAARADKVVRCDPVLVRTYPPTLGAVAPKFANMDAATTMDEATHASVPVWEADNAEVKAEPPTAPSCAIGLNETRPHLRVFATHEGTLVSCNAAFEELTGRTEDDFRSSSAWARDGLLPWGGDAFAVMASSDDDVLGYVRACAAAFSRVPWPASFPAMRRVVVRLSLGGLPILVTVVESLSLERTSVDVHFVVVATSSRSIRAARAEEHQSRLDEMITAFLDSLGDDDEL